MKKIFYSLIIALSLLSCKKEKQRCEIWEYYDQCIAKTAGIGGCGINPITTGHVCNDDLDGISPGSTKVTLDNSDVTITRHYIRKVG